MCLGALLACMSMSLICVCSLQRSEDDIESFGAGDTDGSELMWVLGVKPRSSGRAMLLPAEPSLQSQFCKGFNQYLVEQSHCGLDNRGKDGGTAVLWCPQ